MTQEEKQLLFKDLCVRLPYGVVIRTDCKDIKLDNDHRGIGMLYYEHYSEEAKKECGYDENDCSIIISGCYYGDIKPYLRPMSSMTEEERDDFRRVGGVMSHNVQNDTWALSAFSPEAYDWLNAYHFDYRGLIEKGLALEAPEDMYDIPESDDSTEPTNVKEAVETLNKILSQEDREYLFENGAISMHDSLGRWIRNEWGLWSGSELKKNLEKEGFEHPDDMSNYIIEQFIDKYKNYDAER